MAKRMKRKPSEDKAPSSATPGQEPPPAEMGNQHAQGQWWDPVPQAPVGSEREARTDPAAMSEEELEALSPTEAESGGTVKLTHPIPLPPGVLSQKAMQLKALERYKGFIEDLFPRVYQLLCNEQKFLRGTEPRELAFIETHGRRWRAGEGFLVGAEGLPPVPELKFDPSPAKLVASCKMLRSQCDGIKLSRRNKTLAEHVKDVTRPFTAHRNAVRSFSVREGRGMPVELPRSLTRHLRVRGRLFSLEAARLAFSWITWLFGVIGSAQKKRKSACGRAAGSLEPLKHLAEHKKVLT
jgi:hypothetical protein